FRRALDRREAPRPEESGNCHALGEMSLLVPLVEVALNGTAPFPRCPSSCKMATLSGAISGGLEHPADVRRFPQLINKDHVFDTRRCPRPRGVQPIRD